MARYLPNHLRNFLKLNEPLSEHLLPTVIPTSLYVGIKVTDRCNSTLIATKLHEARCDGHIGENEGQTLLLIKQRLVVWQKGGLMGCVFVYI